MKILNLFAAALLASAISIPGAMAQNSSGGQSAGGNQNSSSKNNDAKAANQLPSQRITQGRPNGTGALVTVSPSGVRETQQRLNQLGYFAGPVNGVWDKATADAMAHFQQAHGLEPTGNLNFSSIAALGLYERIVSNPLGNGNQALAGANATGAPPQRGKETSGSSSNSAPAQK